MIHSEITRPYDLPDSSESLLDLHPDSKWIPLTQREVDNGELNADWRKDVGQQSISSDQEKFGSSGYTPGGVSWTGGEPIVQPDKGFRRLIKGKGRK